MISNVFLMIQNNVHILFAKNLVFRNLKSFAHDNFVDAKSNYYDEARLAQINLRIREKLKSYITLVTQRQVLTLFNFFIEVKGLDNSETIIKRQACHDNVLGERDVRKLMTFKMNNFETMYNNDVHTITSIYYSAIDTLQMYTIHQT